MKEVIEYTSKCKECAKLHWRWGDCDGLKAYQPSEIIYCWWQVMWLIGCKEDAHDPNETETGYVDNPEGHATTRSQHAPHESFPALEIAEVYRRLKTTGDCGDALIDEIRAGIRNISSLSRPAFRALNYASGKIKRMGFRKWESQRERRGNDAKKASILTA